MHAVSSQTKKEDRGKPGNIQIFFGSTLPGFHPMEKTIRFGKVRKGSVGVGRLRKADDELPRNAKGAQKTAFPG
jgi:hypothetical protein